MSGRQVAPGLLSWGSQVEQATIDQAARAARLPVVEGHVALMPDAHVGLGSTVGSVVPTRGAVIPSCVGVDIGCGMVASETRLTASDLPDDLGALMPLVASRVPAGVGGAHPEPVAEDALAALGRPRSALDSKQERTAALQFGSLGSATTSSRSASTSATVCGPSCTRARAASATSSRSGPSPTPRG